MVRLPEGHWGPPTSSVDWCEANYRFTPYVCELFNTLSSLAMVAVGLVGLARYWAKVERRFLVAFFAIALVGLGSALFHATLRYELQMLDELPMVYLALVMVFTLLEIEPGRRYGNRLPIALVLYGALVTVVCVFARGRFQFWFFQVSFGLIEMFALYRVYLLYRASESPRVRRLFRLGMGSYILAVELWFVDIAFCDFVSRILPSVGIPNPELHAVWHVLVSFGFYLLVVLVAEVRAAALHAHSARVG